MLEKPEKPLIPDPEEVLNPLIELPTEVIDAIKPFIAPIEPRLAEINTIATLGRKSLEPITTTLEASREAMYFLTSILRIPYKIFQSVEQITDVLLGKQQP